MKGTLCRQVAVLAIFLALPGCSSGQELDTIILNEPDLTRGRSFMETVSVKASTREWSERELSLQDLSDLLWAANGLNRPDENKTTASSAGNAHDTDIYVFMEKGAYVYDFHNHELDPVVAGDYRSELMMSRPPRRPEPTEGETEAAAETPPPPPPPQTMPPVQIILVSDSERFGPMGTPELKKEWGAIGTGIISQNISLFCAATELTTRPRASMDKERIGEILQLKDSQHVFLNHAVGYPPD